MGKRKVIIEEMCDEIKRLKQKMEEIQKGNEEIEEETSVDSDEVESGSENGEKCEKQNKVLGEENKENEIVEDNTEEVQEKILDEDILVALGNDPTETNEEKVELHSSIKKRWKYWFFNGIDEKDMDALLKKYPPPTGLEAPKLNPEFVTTLAEASVKRDNHIAERQKLATAALSVLGSAINNILVEEEGIDKAEFIGKLNDAAKLINQIIFGQTKSRKAFILPGVEKQRKVLLEKCYWKCYWWRA